MDDCTRARSAIEALIDGELGIAEEADLQTHLAGCPACSKDLEERRAFSVSLGTALRQSMPRTTAEEKKALVDRLARRPGFQWLRLAATVLVALSVAIAGYASGVFGPKADRTADAYVKATAETVANRDAAQARYEELISQLEKMTDELRDQLPVENPTQAEQTAQIELAALEDRICEVAYPGPVTGTVDEYIEALSSDKALERAKARRALRKLGPESMPAVEAALNRVSKSDRWFLEYLLRRKEASKEPTNEIVQSNGDVTIEFRQFGDAKVQIVIKQGDKTQTIEADCMRELQKKHDKFCKQYGISGRDGAVQVGDAPLEAPFEEQLGIAYGHDEDYGPWRRHALEKLVQTHEKDMKEVQKILVNVEIRCKQAAEKRDTAWKADPRSVDHKVHYYESWDRAKLDEVRRQAEKDLATYQMSIEKCAELQGRLNELKVYVQEVKARK